MLANDVAVCQWPRPASLGPSRGCLMPRPRLTLCLSKARGSPWAGRSSSRHNHCSSLHRRRSPSRLRASLSLRTSPAPSRPLPWAQPPAPVPLRQIWSLVVQPLSRRCSWNGDGTLHSRVSALRGWQLRSTRTWPSSLHGPPKAGQGGRGVQGNLDPHWRHLVYVMSKGTRRTARHNALTRAITMAVVR